MYYIGVKDGKRKKKKKKAQINLSILVFYPTINLATSRCIQHLKTLAVIGAEKFVTENSIGEKEKWTTKGKDKQKDADSLLHNTTSHTQHVY